MNTQVHEDIFIAYKRLMESTQYQPVVLKKANGSNYPLITLEMIDNSLDTISTDRSVTYSKSDYEVNIYAPHIELDGVSIENVMVAWSLADETDKFMIAAGLHRISCRPTPNIDKDLYRITMRFNAKQDDYRGRLY